MFPASTYTARRRQLMAAMGSGLIWLPGNEDSPLNYADNVYPYRQDSTFLYYIGIDHPGFSALIDADEGTTTLFADDASIDDVIWTGPQPSVAETAALCGIEHVAPAAHLPAALSKAASKGQGIHYLPPYRADTMIQMATMLAQGVTQVKAGASRQLIQAVVAQRACKSEEELAELERAVNVSGAMHRAAMAQARAGMRESELVGLVEGMAISEGGRVGYSVIMTVNGQTLHNHHYGNTLRPGQLLLGDFGAETALRYTGDITRTFPVDKTFTAQQREIYEVVLAAETQAIAALRPGQAYRDVHLLAAKVIATGLKDAGLMQGDVDEAVAAGAHALFFPHGLGHALGLDVHDMEGLGEDHVGYDEQVQRSSQFGLRSLRLGRALPAGFVLTVEPGIYFIPELIQQWQAKGMHKDFIRYDRLGGYLGFGGIRIEDNVCITADGHRVLGEPIPKTVAEVEALRGA